MHLSDLPSESTSTSEAEISHIQPSNQYEIEKPYIINTSLAADQESLRSNIQYDRHIITIHDLRTNMRQPNVHDDGFQLVQVPNLTMSEYFTIPEPGTELQGVVALLRKHFDTPHVFAYDQAVCPDFGQASHTKLTIQYRNELRSETGSSDPSKVEARQTAAIAHNPHSDATHTSGPRRIRRHLKDEEYARFDTEEWRIRIVNFWKPIKHKATRAPLLLCDHYSIRESDHVPCDVIEEDYVGEVLLLKHHAEQMWFYYSDQDLDEALLFVSFDNDPNAKVPYCFHTSCTMLDQDRRDAPPRESVEVRAIVVTRRS